MTEVLPCSSFLSSCSSSSHRRRQSQGSHAVKTNKDLVEFPKKALQPESIARAFAARLYDAQV